MPTEPQKQVDPQFQRVWEATIKNGHLLPNAMQVRQWCLYFWNAAKETEADEPSSPIELKFKDWYVQKFAVPDLKVHLHYEAIYADMAEAFAAGYRACEEASVSSTDNRKLAQAEVMARTVRS